VKPTKSALLAAVHRTRAESTKAAEAAGEAEADARAKTGTRKAAHNAQNRALAAERAAAAAWDAWNAAPSAVLHVPVSRSAVCAFLSDNDPEGEEPDPNTQTDEALQARLDALAADPAFPGFVPATGR
jgi:hypothetical protein